MMLRRRFRRCLPTLKLAAWSIWLISLARMSSAHVYTDSFPTYDEYDSTILDPNTVYGSPYGGFSRATRSRLASLPLHLPAEVMEGDESLFEDDYYRVRDGDGRLYVCRVYHENELDPTSLSDSMFTTPKRRTAHTSEDRILGASDTETASVPVSGVDKDEVHQHSSQGAVTDSEVSEKEARQPELESPQDSVGRVITVERNLGKLRGVCTQIHLGWWSYEWCHEDSVTQFHISIVAESSASGQRLDLTDVTSLGKYKKRTIRAPEEDNPIENGESKAINWAEMREGLQEIAWVTDEYVGGDVCPETGHPRATVVHYRCCSIRKMSRFKAGVLLDGETRPSHIAALVKLKEDPVEVCTYEATVCTPLLCTGVDDKYTDTLNAGGSKKLLESHQKLPKKDDESIRYTLERVLGNACLQKSDGGWWMYEICYGKHARQFHEATVLDRVTGVSAKATEKEHLLGLYSAEVLESFADEDEASFVVNATDDVLAGASGGDKEHVGGILVKPGTRPSQFGGNGAYFVQEFTGGDVCDHSDVTDAAIKAGSLGEGHVERSTTMRYFCGASPELLQVNEDSTCHYVADISVPDLCEHPLFKSPVYKKQVIKCLPVESQ